MEQQEALAAQVSLLIVLMTGIAAVLAPLRQTMPTAIKVIPVQQVAIKFIQTLNFIS